MDLKLIQRLIALMKRGGVAELDVEDTELGLKLRLKRESGAAPAAPMVQLVHSAAQGAAPAVLSGVPPATAVEAAPAARPAQEGRPLPSPMVGTFYRAPSPEAEPFVQVGTRIGPETVVCIIEAMKVMNEIKAETSGKILAILVENGEPVEFGQPLFLLEP
jgi:acetyl-CoA carboxylase biotin carboxyl carrier protein